MYRRVHSPLALEGLSPEQAASLRRIAATLRVVMIVGWDWDVGWDWET